MKSDTTALGTTSLLFATQRREVGSCEDVDVESSQQERIVGIGEERFPAADTTHDELGR